MGIAYTQEFGNLCYQVKPVFVSENKALRVKQKYLTVPSLMIIISGSLYARYFHCSCLMYSRTSELRTPWEMRCT